VDLGVKSLATLSTGEAIKNPRPLIKQLQKIKRFSRSISRKQKGSNNRRKAIIKLARLHWRITNLRMDTLHKLSTYLAKNHSQIVIEDLYVKGLVQNKRISKEIHDVGFYELRRQLEYKTKWYGSKLELAPRFFPSSKRCSNCGRIKSELKLSKRLFICESCNFRIDRDYNAALNLVAASWAETENACRETGGCRPITGQCLSMMQEPNTIKAADLCG
jgi:putative transposase